jgi:D-Tyr-tRNAtyr deacylase
MILENFLKEIRNKVNSLIQDNYTINLVQNNSIKVINPAKRGKVALFINREDDHKKTIKSLLNITSELRIFSYTKEEILSITNIYSSSSFFKNS